MFSAVIKRWIGRGDGRSVLRRRSTRLLWSAARFILLASLSFVLLYPLLYMLTMAFRPPDSMYDAGVVWIPRMLTLENLKTVWGLMQFPTAVWNTLSICIVSSLMTVISCALAGYGFARFHVRFKNLLFGGVLLSILIPPQTIIIPMFIDMQYFDFMFVGQIGRLITGAPFTVNLYDTPFAMYLPALFANGIRAGLFIYIYRQFFRGLPRELEDAACVDGCGVIRTFLRIVIPCSGTAFLTVFLFSFVFYWNDYYYTGMMYSNLNIVSLALSSLQSKLNGIVANIYDPYATAPYLQAGSFLTILLPLSIYLIFQKYFTESIERTGIVG